MDMSSNKQSFPAPTIDYAVGDLLDPGQVPAAGTVVHCTYPFAAAVRVDMYWEGVSLHTDFKVVPSGGVPQVDFPITQALVIANLNTTVQVYYLVDGVASARQPLRIQVAPLELPAPTVKDAPNGVLDPMNALTGATMTVAYDDMQPVDTVSPIWNGRNDVIEWKPGNGSKSVDFLVPASLVAASLGKTFDVDYGVLREGKVLASQVLRLTVSPIDPVQLPTPDISQADPSRVVDLNTFAGDASVFVAPWPLIAEGQTFWLSAAGTLADGSPWIWNAQPPGYAITASDVANGVGRPIPRTDLETLKDASNLTVTCKVGFDRGASEVPAVAFPSASFLVKGVLPREVFIDFTQEVTVYLKAVEFYNLQYFKITQLVDNPPGGYPLGTAGVSYPSSMTSSKCLIISRKMRVDLYRKDARQISFLLFNSRPEWVVNFWFYDTAGDHVLTWYQSGSLSGSVCSTGRDIMFSSIEIEVVAGGVACLDDIHIYY